MRDKDEECRTAGDGKACYSQKWKERWRDKEAAAGGGFSGISTEVAKRYFHFSRCKVCKWCSQ